MLYKNLKKYLDENTGTDDHAALGLIPKKIGSKLIFLVGDRAANTSAFLSSIMMRRGIPHTRYINSDIIECKDRYLQNGKQIYIGEICHEYQYVAKKTKRSISGDWMSFIIALRALKRKEEYMLLDLTNDIYESLIKNSSLVPFAVIFCNSSDENNEKLISITPSGVSEMISLSQRDNYDYISNTKNPNGVHLSYSSPNKFIIFHGDTYHTEFFRYDELYTIPSVDTSNIQLACLAIEAASVIFHIPYPYIYQGLERSKPIYGVKCYHSEPCVFFKIGDGEYKLHPHIKPKVVYEKDFNGERPKFPTLYIGSNDFYDKIKKLLKT